jgi:hypothetical protein
VSVQVTKSIDNLQHDEWTEHTRIYAGGKVAYRVNVECTDFSDTYGWYSAHLMDDRGVLITSMSAGPIDPDMFTAIVDAWLGQVVD